MASSKLLQSLLSFCLVALVYGAGVSITDQPLRPTVAATGDKSIISSYSSLLSSISSDHPGGPHGPRGPPKGGRTPGALCNLCESCTDCAGWGLALDLNTQVAGEAPQLAFTDDVQVPVAVSATPTASSGLESMVASTSTPYTAQANPTRTTIYQAILSHSTLPEHSSKNNEIASENLEKQSEEKDSNDITEQYYTSMLDGYASSIVPIIVQDDQGTPVTLLTYAKTIFTFNLISADLVEQLNLTHRVSKLSSLSDFDPYNDFDVISGRIASVTGTISLNVVAGQYNARIADAVFLVFKPVTDPKLIKPESQGKLQPDIYAGVDLLYRAGALTIRDDFVGIAPKKGLGIVVQKVFNSITTSKERVKEVSHNEL